MRLGSALHACFLEDEEVEKLHELRIVLVTFVGR